MKVPAEAEVDWKVDLVNRKAALNRTIGPARPRNTGVADRDRFIIRSAKPVVIAGADQPAAVVRASSSVPMSTSASSAPTRAAG